jgi:hypothetical protein
MVKPLAGHYWYKSGETVSSISNSLIADNLTNDVKT